MYLATLLLQQPQVSRVFTQATNLENFNTTKRSLEITPIVKLMTTIYNLGLTHQLPALAWSLCSTNDSNKTLLSKIIKKAFTLEGGHVFLQRLFSLCTMQQKLIPLQPTYFSTDEMAIKDHYPTSKKAEIGRFEKLKSWVSGKREDLSDSALNALLTLHKYQQMLSHRRNDQPAPELETWTVQEIQTLTQQNTELNSQYFNDLLNLDPNITDVHGFESPISDSRRGELLHLAIKTRKTNLIKYLLHIKANVNAVDRSEGSYQTTISSALNLGFTHLLGPLFNHRQPISAEELSSILNFCIQNRKNPDESTNNKLHNQCLYDHALSLLLGMKIDSTLMNKKNVLKYLAHHSELGGLHIDAKWKSDAKKFFKKIKEMYRNETLKEKTTKLTGFHRDVHLQIRLRLLLEVIIEEYIAKGIDEKATFKEFLSALETAWVINHIKESKRVGETSRRKIRKENEREFCQGIAKYLYKQITHIAPGDEYILYSGWTGHAICVVFKFIDFPNGKALEIRIDNLGSGVSRHPKPNKKKEEYQPYIVAQIPEHELQSYSQSLKTYLSRLVYHSVCKECDEGEALRDIYLEIDRAHNPLLVDRAKVFKKHQNICNKYPAFPKQAIGNCVVKSYIIAPQIRSAVLFETFLSLELGCLNRILRNQNFSRPTTSSQSIKTDRLPTHSFLELMESRIANYYGSAKFIESLHHLAMHPKITSIDPEKIFPEHVEVSTLFFYYKYREHEFADPSKDKARSTGPCQIKIEGGAKMGKTFYAKQLAHQLQKNFPGLVIYLSLSEMTNLERYPSPPTLIDIIKKEIFERALGRPLLHYETNLLEREFQTSKFLWILDNDLPQETVPQHHLDVVQRLYSQPRIIVFSRPSGAIDLNPYDYKLIINYENSPSSINLDRFNIERSQRSDHQALNALLRIPPVRQHIKEFMLQRNSNWSLGELIYAASDHLHRFLINAIQIEPKRADLTFFFYSKICEFFQLLPLQMISSPDQSVFTREIIDQTFSQMSIDSIYQNELTRLLNLTGIVEINATGGRLFYSILQDHYLAYAVANMVTYVDPRGALLIENILKNPEEQSIFLQAIHLLKLNSKGDDGIFISSLGELLRLLTLNNDGSLNFYSLAVDAIAEIYLKVPSELHHRLNGSILPLVEAAVNFVGNTFLVQEDASSHDDFGYKRFFQEETTIKLSLEKLLLHYPDLKRAIDLPEKILGFIEERNKLRSQQGDNRNILTSDIFSFIEGTQCSTVELLNRIVGMSSIFDLRDFSFISKMICSIAKKQLRHNSEVEAISSSINCLTIMLTQAKDKSFARTYLVPIHNEIENAVVDLLQLELPPELSTSKNALLQIWIHVMCSTYSTVESRSGTPVKYRFYSTDLAIIGHSLNRFLNVPRSNEITDFILTLLMQSNWVDVFIRSIRRIRISEVSLTNSIIRENALKALESCLGVILMAIDRKDNEFGTRLIKHDFWAPKVSDHNLMYPQFSQKIGKDFNRAIKAFSHFYPDTSNPTLLLSRLKSLYEQYKQIFDDYHPFIDTSEMALDPNYRHVTDTIPSQSTLKKIANHFKQCPPIERSAESKVIKKILSFCKQNYKPPSSSCAIASSDKADSISEEIELTMLQSPLASTSTERFNFSQAHVSARSTETLEEYPWS